MNESLHVLAFYNQDPRIIQEYLETVRQRHADGLVGWGIERQAEPHRLGRRTKVTLVFKDREAADEFRQDEVSKRRYLEDARGSFTYAKVG